jgi:mediator of RNA polymerase II transcription subunit 5
VPSLHEVHANVTNRLEHFRTEILDSIDPVDEKKEAVDAAMSEILDSAVGLDSIVITEIPISNTRAGLYVYINASVSDA